MPKINIRRGIASNFIVPSTKFGGRGKQKINTKHILIKSLIFICNALKEASLD